MKQAKWLSIAAFAATLAACNGNGTNNGTADTTATTTTTTTTESTGATASTGNYAAMADSFRVNSQAGNYLDAKTGKPIRIKYDATTRRAVNEETNQPVWRYVDRRTWWVYGADNDNWNQVGEARMDGSTLKYKSSSNDNWLSYDERWSEDDQRYMNSMNDTTTVAGSTEDAATGSNGEVKVKDNGNKVKDKDVKVKTSNEGDIKIKDKQTGEKVKYNADNGKVKSGH
ncbi:hypothetical protein [Flaviaesturariibacter aridisoli]|uniref:Lipoprotein n=1 Tax=Flaviaesturariibacter aridisoli TaxID=2545761 RepID=A0A4R4DY80_9BACT|nr:hypothetical protein [Flaviaesturariibacter aridisoli]TCZ70486.1 hypothetical protein E0486_11055 [Flaviaesturariibacter aridisoli]